MDALRVGRTTWPIRGPMGPTRAYQNLIRPHLGSWFGQCFERLCREAFPRLYEKEGVTAPFETGAYWSKTTQIDIVGLREDGWTDLSECKWSPVRSAKAVEEELERKVREYPNQRGATVGRRVFTRQGYRGGGQWGIAWRISIHRPEVPYTGLFLSASRAARWERRHPCRAFEAEGG